MSLTPFTVIWAVLAFAVAALAMARNLAGLHEEGSLHLSAGSQTLISEQASLLGVIRKIERWGKSLTVITVVSGIVLGAVYMWQTIPMAGNLVR